MAAETASNQPTDRVTVVTGQTNSFSFEDALADAFAHFPVGNPDEPRRGRVLEIEAEFGGFVPHARRLTVHVRVEA